jgi:hypothetical protein
MRRPILLRLFLALGAARYSRAFGFSSGNYETDFYRRYDFPAQDAPSPVGSESDHEASIDHETLSTSDTRKSLPGSSVSSEPHEERPPETEG